MYKPEKILATEDQPTVMEQSSTPHVLLEGILLHGTLDLVVVDIVPRCRPRLFSTSVTVCTLED